MSSKNHVLFREKYRRNNLCLLIHQTFPISKSKSYKKLIHNTLFLLSKSSNFHIFEYIPRQFVITTKNGSSAFNIELLKDSSPVISDFIKEHPKDLHYFLNINDEENVLNKFEKLYQGKKVKFNEDDIPTSQKITKLLQIKNCPNNLKLESLHSYECGSIINYDNGVAIDKTSFLEFLQNEDLQTFSIVTNKKEYKCNVFGIYSSNVICKMLTKNSNIKQYLFNFVDENDEFQLICDLFNFKHVEMTNKNIRSLKYIAEKLQIDIILDQLNDFNKKYEDESRKIIEQQKFLDQIDTLFYWLYNISTISVDSVKDLIIQSNWIHSKENIQELVAFILQVIKTSPLLHEEIIELLIKLNNESNETNFLNLLMPFIIEKLMDLFDDHFTFQFIYHLYQREMFPKEQIINRINDFTSENENIQNFFLPEIGELDSENYDILIRNRNQYKKPWNNECGSFIKKYFPQNVDKYKKMLENFEPDDELTKSIRHDDLNTLQMIIIKEKIDISEAFIPYNIFDYFDEKVSLINYSVLFGSTKCFNYLLINNGKVDQKTLLYAVDSGNIEIVKIIYQKLSNENLNKNKINILNFNNNNEIIIKSIIKHQKELFDWIFEEYILYNNFDEYSIKEIASISALNGYAYPIIKIINSGFKFSYDLYIKIITKAAKKGFCKLTQLLFNIIPDIPKKTDSIKYDKFTCFGNFEIFKVFIKSIDIKALKKVLISAIQDEDDDIINYILDNFSKNTYQFSSKFIHKVLETSLTAYDNHLFNLILNKFETLTPKVNKVLNSYFLLSKACQNKNLPAARTITDYILIKDPKYDFTDEFLEAVSSGSNEICKYFIQQNVNIDYEAFIYRLPYKLLIDYDVFLTIYNKINSITKEEWYKCLNKAISSQNKEITEFLLKNNVKNKYALIKAVLTNDIKMVDLVLKYNNDTFFINQMKSGKTALLLAVEKQNLPIVKRLLSIPGINPNLVNKSNEYPLISSIKLNNIEIIDALLDFYGEEFQSNTWMITDVMNALINLYKNKIYKTVYLCYAIRKSYLENDQLFDIIKRFFDIKSIDPNFSDDSTFLYKACVDNKIEMVEYFLTLDKIDVNKYSCKLGQSPLIGALINCNTKIAEILIKYPKTNINYRDFKNQTALTIAVQKKYSEIVDLLIHDDRFNPIESRLNHALKISTGNITSILSSLK